MGVIIGWAVGYVMGAKAGEQGVQELKEAWTTIRKSEEAHRLAAGGLLMARSLASRGAAMVAERFQGPGSGSGSVSTLRPTG